MLAEVPCFLLRCRRTHVVRTDYTIPEKVIPVHRMLLVIFGAVALVYWGISLTTDKRVVNPGPVPATVARKEAVSSTVAAGTDAPSKENAKVADKADKPDKSDRPGKVAAAAPVAAAENQVPLAPVFGGVSILAGLALLVLGARRNRKLLA